MAVDTRDKRFSVISMGRPWTPTLPNPDGGFAIQGDRQHIVYLYRGIDADAPVATYHMNLTVLIDRVAEITAIR